MNAIKWSRLEAAVERYADQGVLGVSAVTSSGSHWSVNGDRQFRAASVMKIPMMIEIFREIDRRERTLDDVYALKSTDKAPGTGVLLNLHDGLEVTLRDLVYLMISISDNTATNMLIRDLTMPPVNATMRLLGMSRSNLSREMKGRPATGYEQENWATPTDYVDAVRSILDEEAASSESCGEMLRLLQKQQNNRRIARFLPNDDSIVWGGKGGTIEGVANDVGFVTTPVGTIVLGVFCEGVEEVLVAEQAIGDISLAAMLDCGLLDMHVQGTEAAGNHG